jgi:hypothetical protein
MKKFLLILLLCVPVMSGTRAFAQTSCTLYQNSTHCGCTSGNMSCSLNASFAAPNCYPYTPDPRTVHTSPTGGVTQIQCLAPDTLQWQHNGSRQGVCIAKDQTKPSIDTVEQFGMVTPQELWYYVNDPCR